MNNCSNTEAQIVFENNHDCCCSIDVNPQCYPKYGPDTINVFNALGKHVGYSWNFGDSVELAVIIQNTVLRVDDEHLEELVQYLTDKEIELNLINIRGEVVYTFYQKAELITKFKLNTAEDNLIERNTYTITAVLINPADQSRINLFFEPYKLFVK